MQLNFTCIEKKGQVNRFRYLINRFVHAQPKKKSGSFHIRLAFNRNNYNYELNICTKETISFSLRNALRIVFSDIYHYFDCLKYLVGGAEK